MSALNGRHSVRTKDSQKMHYEQAITKTDEIFQLSCAAQLGLHDQLSLFTSKGEQTNFDHVGQNHLSYNTRQSKVRENRK